MTDQTKRRIVLVAFAIAVVVMVVWPMIPLKTAEDRLKAIPVSGPGFNAREVPLGDADRKLLGEASAVCDLISLNDGSRLMLTVIDGTRNRHAVHDPFYCFAGAGWKIEEKKVVDLQSGEGFFLTISKEGKRAEALCFYDDGTRQYSAPLQYWLRTSWRRVSLGASGAEPVLVMCRTFPGEHADWAHVRHMILPSLGFR